MSGVIAIMVALLVSAAALAMDFSCGGFDDMTPWDTRWGDSSSSVGTTPEPTARVTGTVTYRERIALSPEAALIVSLEDVSLQDAPSVTIAERVIENAGQVPIYFEIPYAAERIEDWRTYAVQAVIEERGELAFINDTAYDVITYGQPTHVDMVLVMVDGSPSPPSASSSAWVQGVEVNRDGAGYSLEVSFTLSDYCSRFDGYDLSVAGSGIEVALEIADLSAGGSVACAQAIQELSQHIPIEATLTAGESYTVSVNGVLTNSFTTPEDPSVEVVTARSPVESVEVLIMESYPPQYSLHIVSALPKGSSCSWFNGYDIASPYPGRIEVEVTHHEVAELRVCTADYPVVETFVPLGADFESGREYEVVVNGELAERFEAQ